MAKKVPFDVRDTIEESDLDDESVQLIYDAINRMVVLISDVPFKELFQTPVSELARKVRPRLQTAAKLGLLREPAAVDGLIKELVAREKEATVGSFFVNSRDQVSPETHLLLRKLRRHGIRVPVPASDRTKRRVRQSALNKLLQSGGAWTFLDLFTKSAHDAPRGLRTALRNVRLLGLFAWWNNDRCCDMGGGGGGIKDKCVANKGTFCSISKDIITRGFCTAASDTCPGDRPGRPG